MFRMDNWILTFTSADFDNKRISDCFLNSDREILTFYSCCQSQLFPEGTLCKDEGSTKTGLAIY